MQPPVRLFNIFVYLFVDIYGYVPRKDSKIGFSTNLHPYGSHTNVKIFRFYFSRNGQVII